MTFASYFSIAFLGLFFPAAIAVYSVVPKKVRWVVLLLFSYALFFLISGKLLVFIVLSTLSIYGAALRMDTLIVQRKEEAKDADRAQKKLIKAKYAKRLLRVCMAGAVFNLLLLVAMKYLGFFGSIAQNLIALVAPGVTFEVPVWAAPIGISFYTLQAISYLVDVYHGKVKADKNLGRVALFLSFFPTLMEGPICRYEETAHQLTQGERIHRQNLYTGLVRILWGLAKKLIIADRLNMVVKPIFENYGSYDGGVIALAAVAYTIQLYAEFSGTMDVVIGVGNIFNVKLPENFKQPFFSRSASGFWMRWHITLGAWLRDYVFYPVSLSKPAKSLTVSLRKKLGTRYGPLVASSFALFCVWMGNGLWHGAGWQYILFGMYYFVLIVVGSLIDPGCAKLAEKLGLDRESLPYRIFQILRTWIIIFVGELIFRAEGLDAVLTMLGGLFGNFTLESYFNGVVMGIGMDLMDYLCIAVAVVVLLIVGLIHEKDIWIGQWAWEKNLAVRLGVLVVLIMAMVVFGAYGHPYIPLDPIYANF